jgi:hypothetical protein
VRETGCSRINLLDEEEVSPCWTAVVSSTAAATLRQLVMFIDKIIEEDRRMPLTNELESITLPDRLTQALDPGTARGVFAISGTSVC